MRTLGDTPILVSLAQESPDDFVDIVCCWLAVVHWYEETKNVGFQVFLGRLERSDAIQASQE